MIFAPFELNNIMTQIHGTVLGEYFGASLATGDFDNDGYDDLAIGAPHWGDVDVGRVYTYHTKGEVSISLNLGFYSALSSISIRKSLLSC